MKKILALLLATILIIVLSACKKENNPTDSNANPAPQTGTTEFVKPENYASVVLITINPQFKLYLDDSGEVLAVEPVNDDAKSIANNITIQKGNIEAVIDNIVTATNTGGFVKDEVTVNFEITEINNTTINADTILDKAKTSADTSFKKLEVEVEVKTSIAENASKTENSDNTLSDTSVNTTSTPTPTHTHSFSAATCTAPKKCSCGATEGSALGHSYKNGVCSRCKAKDPNASYTAVTKKNGSWSLKYVIDDVLYSVSLKLYGSAADFGVGVSFGDALSNFPESEQKLMKEDCVKFEGEYYYCARGDGDSLSSVTESGNTVTVTDNSGNKLVLTRTGENSLKVHSSPADFCILGKVPVGSTLTFKAN